MDVIAQLLFCVAPNEIKTVELDEEDSFAESWTQEHKVNFSDNLVLGWESSPLGDNFGSGVHLQPCKDGKREVNNDEAPALDCAKDPGLPKVFAQTFSFVTLWLLF